MPDDSADAALSLIASDAVFAEFTEPSFDSAQFASAVIAADQGAAARGGGGARATECVLVAQTPFEVDAWASAIRETKGALVTAAGSPARQGPPLTLGP